MGHCFLDIQYWLFTVCSKCRKENEANSETDENGKDDGVSESKRFKFKEPENKVSTEECDEDGRTTESQSTEGRKPKEAGKSESKETKDGMLEKDIEINVIGGINSDRMLLFPNLKFSDSAEKEKGEAAGGRTEEKGKKEAANMSDLCEEVFASQQDSSRVKYKLTGSLKEYKGNL